LFVDFVIQVVVPPPAIDPPNGSVVTPSIVPLPPLDSLDVSVVTPSVSPSVAALDHHDLSVVTPPVSSPQAIGDPHVFVSSLSSRCISFHVKEISPLPKAKCDIKIRKVRTTRAAELTGSPYKKDLENAMAAMKLKTKKAPAKILKESLGNGPKNKKRSIKKMEEIPHGPNKKSKVDNSKSVQVQKPECSKKYGTRRIPEQQHQSEDVPRHINFYCGGCSVLYDPSNQELDWLQCMVCHDWWEIDCAGLVGKPKHVQDQFRCDDCLP